MRDKIEKIGYAIAYYVSWYICIQQVAEGNGYIGPAIIGLLLIIHLYLSESITKQLMFLSTMAVVGFTIDSLYLRFGLVSYKALYFDHPDLAPMWIISLWLVFAAALTKTTGWLNGRWLLMIVCGAIGGPLSYSAAIKVGAGHLMVSDVFGYGILAIMWAMIFPCSFALWKYINTQK